MASWNNPNYTPKKQNNFNLGGLYNSIRNARFSWWSDDEINKYKGTQAKSPVQLGRERRNQYPSNQKMRKTITSNKSNLTVKNNTSKFPGSRVEIGYGGNNQSVLGTNPSNLTYGSVPEIPQVGRVNNTPGRTSFRDAFNQARNSGLSEFTWGGKRFNTRNKGEENYTWDTSTKKWVDPLASVKQTATFTTDNIAPISVPRERVETPSFDYAANISDSLTNPNPNRYTLPRTATPTFVGQTNNNWLRDMFRDTFRTFNFG